MSSYSSVSQPTKPSRKKRVLLIDTSRGKRDLRSETMRNLGVDVDCAADVSEARCWWKPNLYDLVVIHVEDSPLALKKFCDDLRTATPPQKIMLLPGEPPDLESAPAENSSTPSRDKKSTVNGSNAKDSDSQHWGIQDACRRISAIRSACDARTKAIRDTPEPTRDSETARPNARLDAALERLHREELQ
jgi:CheY-like chemotaxis protein